MHFQTLPGKISKQVFSVFLSHGASVIFGFGTGIILSRVLGPELKGYYTSMLVIPSIIVSFVMLGGRQSVVYHLGNKLFSAQKIISAALLLFITSSILGILAFSGISLFADSIGYTPLFFISAAALIPVNIFIYLSESIFQAQQKFHIANLLRWSLASLYFLFTFLLVYLFNLSLEGAFLSVLSAGFLTIVLAIFLIKKNYEIKISFDVKTFTSLIGKGIIYALALLIIQLNFRIDILLLDLLSDKTEIGYYSIGVSVAETLWLIPLAIGTVVMSYTAEKGLTQEILAETGRQMRMGFLFMLVLSFILFFIAPYVIPFIYGNAFARSADVIQNILPGILFFVVIRVLSSALAGIGKVKYIIYIFLPMLLLNITLNILWIPDYGCIGAAYATNVSYILGALILLLVFSVISKTPIQNLILFSINDFRHYIARFRKHKNSA